MNAAALLNLASTRLLRGHIGMFKKTDSLALSMWLCRRLDFCSLTEIGSFLDFTEVSKYLRSQLCLKVSQRSTLSIPFGVPSASGFAEGWTSVHLTALRKI